jgi:hypothetical protein
MRRLVFLLTLVGAGCGYTQLAPPPDDVGPSHVWVYKSGAWRLVSTPNGVVSHLRLQLEMSGVEIVRSEQQGPVACRGEGCVPFTVFYALIPRSQLDTAKRLGFTREYGFERGLPPSDATG